MTATSHEIDKMDDIRVLVLSQAQGPCGIATARRHANSLMKRAMKCFDEGNYQAAMRLCTREFEFNCKAFGFSDGYTATSKECLAALKRHYSREAWVHTASTHQLKMERAVSRVG
jgi:hypothetical protein